jgi:nitrate/nitrite transporter NarK
MDGSSEAAPTGQTSALWMSTIAFTACFAVWTIFSIIGIQIKKDLARISHAIFAQLSRVARGLTSFFKGVLARVVRRTRAELGFFLSRGERQRVVSVGRGMMPRL